MLSARQALLQVTVLMLLWCLAHPAFAQITAEWSSHTLKRIYCGAKVCGDTVSSRFLVTSGSGYIDVEQTLQKGLSDVIGTQSRTISLWVEQGIEYEFSLSTDHVNDIYTAGSVSSVCYSVSWLSITLGIPPFNSEFTPEIYLCMAVVEMSERGGDEFQVNASDGDFSDRVRVTWNEQDGATGYEVYRCTSALETDCGAVLGSTASNGYDDTGGALNTTYYYRVKACSGGPCGDFSPADPGFRFFDAPDAPSLDSAIPGNGEIELNFTANGDGGSVITGFTASCGAFDQSGSTSPITVSGLANGVEYSCTVVATNVIGDSPPSNALSATPSAPDQVFRDGFED